MTRNAIERATQKARRLLEDDFAAQLEGTYDVLENGTVAPKPGPHLTLRQAIWREKLVASIAHKRAAGMSPRDAVTDYRRDAAFTTLNLFAALKMLEARHLVQPCISKGEQSSGYQEFCGLAPGVALLPRARDIGCTSRAFSTSCQQRSRCCSTGAIVSASVLWPRRGTFEELLALFNAPELARVWGGRDDWLGVPVFQQRRGAPRDARRLAGSRTAGSWPFETSSSRRGMWSSSWWTTRWETNLVRHAVWRDRASREVRISGAQAGRGVPHEAHAGRRSAVAREGARRQLRADPR